MTEIEVDRTNEIVGLNESERVDERIEKQLNEVGIKSDAVFGNGGEHDSETKVVLVNDGVRKSRTVGNERLTVSMFSTSPERKNGTGGFGGNRSDGDESSVKRTMTYPDRIEIPDSDNVIVRDPFRQRGSVPHLSVPVKVPQSSKDARVEANTDVKKKPTAALNKPPFVKAARKRTKDGQTVYKGHPSWSIVLAIQFGLTHTHELVEQHPHEEFQESDFYDRLIFYFDVASEKKPKRMSSSGSTRWDCHAPFIYRSVRAIYEVDELSFLESTCMASDGESSAVSKLRELHTPGKSGALFYITEDERFFLKTITNDEEETLNEFLPSYYEHIQKYPDTLLNRYLANFGMRARNGRHIRFVAMSSVFRDGLEIDLKFDLKGSTLGRISATKNAPLDLESSESGEFAEDSHRDGVEKVVTLKDLDLVEPLLFEKKTRSRLMELLGADSAVLEKHSIMDYSLLLGLSEVRPENVGIFDSKYGEKEENAPWSIAYQTDRDGIIRKYRVSMGIIDILQTFSPRKKLEYAWKSTRYCTPDAISVNPPWKYRTRFLHFFEEKFLEVDPESIEKSPQFSLNLAHAKTEGRKP
uniref:PIPK domain-containing protein n=1 Tax=Timspurckia oligopyrenoides TaxID=708627 RepID=A0A7S0ZGW9_9RHOD|mmetsp:Transcript_4734/g.8270  ORF Transcript_4734/g.8270 Transcript_4734/m.8270 type:complete len:583 (+) Transcript_4734:237-1985(+)|eukprot:CAMPEP_0182447724 /NCGR_PEP_ID=MMETSP1172-20130603/19404_1 /TAXON_ID=708627 /ORGANISM="Timspurckia oligopyrenoides, Strain CCMP3278" /LENGTH=582 /DNA_ID=CAMNT_0024644269 /DNA_START=122 /DNA_END=1870 /DNA_ORIENTATION=+